MSKDKITVYEDLIDMGFEGVVLASRVGSLPARHLPQSKLHGYSIRPFRTLNNHIVRTLQRILNSDSDISH